MTTILPAARSPWHVIDQAIGQQLSQNLPNAIQQGMNRGMLQQSFNQLNPQADFLDQLKQIAPTLLSTPGGAQALEALAPILGKYAENKAYRGFIENQRNRQGIQTSINQPNAPLEQHQALQQPTKPIAPSADDYYRNPTAYASPESLYPERATGPQETPEMSLAQQNAAVLDYMEHAAATGKPVSVPEAWQAIQNQNNIIRQQNELVRKEKELQKAANKELVSGMVARAQNSNLIKDPEDVSVAEKLALDARRLEDPNKQWQFVRSGLRKFDENKSKIERAADLTGPLGRLYRRGMGTYQDKDQLIKSVQPAIDAYKEYGLHNELRRDLADSLGLGPEDTERAIFPFSKQEQKQISSIPDNPKNMLNKQGEYPLVFKEMLFPDENFSLNPEQYDTFKEQVYDVIKDNPKINLVALRGELNQKGRYAWQDVTKVIEELAEEGRFIPDAIQEQQMGMIGKPPAAGILDLFRYTWKGTK